MPVYDFKCRSCGKESELILRQVGEIPNCPECGSSNLERRITASYVMKAGTRNPGTTCCGRTERCEKPPCSTENSYHRDRKG